MNRLLRLRFFISVFVFLSWAVMGCNQSPTSQEAETSTPFGGDVVAKSDTSTLDVAAPGAFDEPPPTSQEAETSTAFDGDVVAKSDTSTLDVAAPGAFDEPQASAPDEPGAWGTTEASPLTPSPAEFPTNPDLGDIHFDFDRHNIRPDDTAILDENAEWMTANPNYAILVQGHADERGTTEYNQALGERRAESTKNYLIARGVAADRIRIISYGEEQPVCTMKNDACWAQNRRAHFTIRAL